ncbi:UCH domain-containing protein [Cephalotus follicularis]|uniref:UCH domain-containing protein n=1 Tax=Cephalotus follicularis TaxID=3775 RepID=A0A1Q3CEG4_CEPFO|nr:UCH domain-containing protein [Cephalotus follicularis]
MYEIHHCKRIKPYEFHTVGFCIICALDSLFMCLVNYFVLNLQLKRFFSPRNKIREWITFPLSLDMVPYSSASESMDYNLYGMIVHKGIYASLAHYYAFIHSSSSWYKLDDEDFSPVSEQEVLKQEMYILFYRRHTIKMDTPPNYFGSTSKGRNNEECHIPRGLILSFHSSFYNVCYFSTFDISIHFFSDNEQNTSQTSSSINSNRVNRMIGEINNAFSMPPRDEALNTSSTPIASEGLAPIFSLSPFTILSILGSSCLIGHSIILTKPIMTNSITVVTTTVPLSQPMNIVQTFSSDLMVPLNTSQDSLQDLL